MSTRLAAALRVVALLAAVLAGPALAHEGHDHGAAQPPVSKTIAPRGEALSDTFELVAIPRDGTLTLFLDRFRTSGTAGSRDSLFRASSEVTGIGFRHHHGFGPQ